jgi:hypothetical protein
VSPSEEGKAVQGAVVSESTFGPDFHQQGHPICRRNDISTWSRETLAAMVQLKMEELLAVARSSST